MSLNIKNERVHDLAREAARVTGKTQTGAIEEALVLLLQHHGVEPRRAELDRKIERLREITETLDRLPIDPDREIRTLDDLYDESGLPR